MVVAGNSAALAWALLRLPGPTRGAFPKPGLGLGARKASPASLAQGQGPGVPEASSASS